MIASTSYQLSFPGCRQIGLSDSETTDLMKRSIKLVEKARAEFLSSHLAVDRKAPLIGASLGPYGAFLANGAEYTGDYQITTSQLRDFHVRRLEVMEDTNADLVMLETIPSLAELTVLAEIITDLKKNVCLSLTCKNETQIRDGSAIEEAASLFNNIDNVVAIGVNCTQPKYVLQIVQKILHACPSKEVMAYPNSGEIYDGHEREWKGHSDIENFGQLALGWRKAGARILGGCCRTGPNHIQTIRSLDSASSAE